jgi:hypothetical protein
MVNLRVHLERNNTLSEICRSQQSTALGLRLGGGEGGRGGGYLGCLLLVQLGAWLLHLAEDVGHASLVPHESGQVRGFAGVIPGERLGLPLPSACPLLGQETQ